MEERKHRFIAKMNSNGYYRPFDTNNKEWRGNACATERECRGVCRNLELNEAKGPKRGQAVELKQAA